MTNTNKLVAGIKAADLSYDNGQFDYRPFSGSVAPLAGLAAGLYGGVAGAGFGALRNRLRPKNEREKHKDMRNFSLIGAAGYGLPVAFAPSLFDTMVKYQIKAQTKSPEQAATGVKVMNWLLKDQNITGFKLLGDAALKGQEVKDNPSVNTGIQFIKSLIPYVKHRYNDRLPGTLPALE
jgi:hypothetical protein